MTEYIIQACGRFAVTAAIAARASFHAFRHATTGAMRAIGCGLEKPGDQADSIIRFVALFRQERAMNRHLQPSPRSFPDSEQASGPAILTNLVSQNQTGIRHAAGLARIATLDRCTVWSMRRIRCAVTGTD